MKNTFVARLSRKFIFSLSSIRVRPTLNLLAVFFPPSNPYTLVFQLEMKNGIDNVAQICGKGAGGNEKRSSLKLSGIVLSEKCFRYN